MRIFITYHVFVVNSVFVFLPPIRYLYFLDLYTRIMKCRHLNSDARASNVSRVKGVYFSALHFIVRLLRVAFFPLRSFED